MACCPFHDDKNPSMKVDQRFHCFGCGADGDVIDFNLLEYAVLEEKAAAATAHHNELSAQIKAAEKRMAEIAVLRTHIVNYAKTREVYVAYRKAG